MRDRGASRTGLRHLRPEGDFGPGTGSPGAALRWAFRPFPQPPNPRPTGAKAGSECNP